MEKSKELNSITASLAPIRQPTDGVQFGRIEKNKLSAVG